MHKPRLASVIALAVLIAYTGLSALGLWIEKDQTIAPQWIPLLNCLGFVLAFPLVLLVLAIEPQEVAGIVCYITAIVLNSYLWGYSIAWVVKRIPRGQPPTQS